VSCENTKSQAGVALLHIHIRKTAGTSVRTLLVNQFPAGRILSNAHSVSGPRGPGTAEFVTGHVGFDYARRFAALPEIFTILREPVSRALSAYQFYRNNDEKFFRAVRKDWSDSEYQARRRFTERARQLDMLQFLQEEERLARTWLANIQTRQLAGGSYLEVRDDDPTLLESGSANLALCLLAGLVERLDDTFWLLGRLMRWGELGPLQHLNRTFQLTETPIDPRCIELLRSWNTLDLHLYQEAAGLLQAKLHAARLQPHDSFPDLALLPDAADFTPEMPIRGYGWHEREFHQDRWLCWTAAPAATLHLRLSVDRPTRFRCFLFGVVDQAALDALQISINSVPLALEKQWTGDGWLLKSAIPNRVGETVSQLARITFDCGAVRRPSRINANSTDGRLLGVAVGWVRID
jgi:hypothetical protein